jgi:hypothetical protein
MIVYYDGNVWEKTVIVIMCDQIISTYISGLNFFFNSVMSFIPTQCGSELMRSSPGEQVVMMLVVVSAGRLLQSRVMPQHMTESRSVRRTEERGGDGVGQAAISCHAVRFVRTISAWIAVVVIASAAGAARSCMMSCPDAG